MLEIKHTNNEKKGEFYIEKNSHYLAEMTYTWADENLLVIDHTTVNDSLRGQGVANQLLDQMVSFAREKKVKVIPLCSFAKSAFEKNPAIQDVLKSSS